MPLVATFGCMLIPNMVWPKMATLNSSILNLFANYSQEIRLEILEMNGYVYLAYFVDDQPKCIRH